MIRSNKNFLYIMSLLLIVVGVILSNREAEIIYYQADYAIDIYNQKEVIGYNDYLFVAYIKKEVDTVYRNVVEVDNGREVGNPFTQYSITVIENIKGDLKKNKPIILEKNAGVSKDHKYLELEAGDSMLKVGQYYIISASAEPDGRLVLGLPTGDMKLSISSKSELDSSEIVIDIKEDYRHEIKFERQRFKSKYEE